MPFRRNGSKRAILHKSCLLLFLPILAGAAAPAAAQVRSCTPRNTVAYLVRFLSAKGEWDITPPDKARITNRDRVEVCIEHFNYLRYTLTFDVAEERSESYDYLTKLWTSVLNPSAATLLDALGAPQPNAPPPTFLQRLQVIYGLATDLDRAIGTSSPSSGRQA